MTVFVLVIVWFSVLVIVFLVGIGSSVLVISLGFRMILMLLSVWVMFAIWIGLSAGRVPLSVLPLPLFSLCIVIVRPVLSMGVGSSISLRFVFLRLTALRFWPLILRVFAVWLVVFHLNYPLIHYICDDK